MVVGFMIDYCYSKRNNNMDILNHGNSTKKIERQ